MNIKLNKKSTFADALVDLRICICLPRACKQILKRVVSF